MLSSQRSPYNLFSVLRGCKQVHSEMIYFDRLGTMFNGTGRCISLPPSIPSWYEDLWVQKSALGIQKREP